MPRQYSRLAQVEKKKATRSVFFYGGLTVLLIVFLFFIGVPALARVAELLLGVRGSDSLIEISDTTPPPPPQLSDIPESTNESKLDIEGAAEPGTTVSVILNGHSQELIANSDGKFSTKLNLREGDNVLFATAKDKAGNESNDSTKYSILFDNTEPSLEITKPTDGAYFSGAKQKQLSVEGKTDPDAQIFINDRIAVVSSTGNFALTFSLNDGENPFTIKAVDKAGNETEQKLTVKYSP